VIKEFLLSGVLTAFLATPAPVTPTTFSFSQSGFKGGGTVNGFFVAST
jgi:hypothetical protein